MTIEDDRAAARLVLQRLGVSPRDLIEDDEHDKAVLLESLVEAVVDVIPEPSRRLYEPYWRKALTAWPS